MSRAERPCCQHVRHTDLSADCARAPGQVRLPPQTLHAERGQERVRSRYAESAPDPLILISSVYEIRASGLAPTERAVPREGHRANRSCI
jgi:hypothetical protein